jgi:Membrane domain of glycerophosphoryl diester phosphodiesterase
MTTQLRPLSTGELLDRTFSLYHRNFVVFLGIVALPHLCVLAFQCLALAFQGSGTSKSSVSQMFVWGLGAALLSIAVSATSHAATVVAVSQVHLDRPAGVMDSYSKVRSQIAAVIGLSFVVGVLVILACIALIVPGVLLAVRWSLAVPAMVLENKGIRDAMSRSTELTLGNRGRVFVVWLLFVILNIGFNWLLHWPIEVAAGVSTMAALHHVAVGWQVASLVATFLSVCLVGPLATIAFSLVYFDERVRKEAFDLQLMMTTLDAPALQGAST